MVVGEFTHETDLLVIGGGPGGYTAAFRAAAQGVQTTIVDSRGSLGGVCLHCGCIPSKTLLYASEMIELPETAEQMGISFNKPKVNLDKLNEWKQGTIDKLVKGLSSTAKRNKVEVITGVADFEDNRHVVLRDSETKRIKFKQAIIAIGSRPVELRGVQIESDRVLNSTTALELKRVPKNLLVIGGGYIGLELGTVMAGLGAEVTVVEMLPNLLPGCDADLARPLVKRLGKAFKEICLETKVTAMEETKSGIKLTFEGRKTPERTTFDQVLVAVGRRPNSDKMNFEAAGVELTDRGFVKVDDQMRTSNNRIFAIGDIVGNPMLAHKASAEAKVAADVIAGHDAVFDVRCCPAVVFTDPEIAWVGVTETEAKEQGLDFVVKKTPWGASGRATAMGRTDGVTKLILDKSTNRVLGVGLAGPHAGEMIAEGALAVEMGAVAEDLAMTIHPHPTISELLSDTADAAVSPGGGGGH